MVSFELYFVRLLCYWFFTLPVSQFCRVFFVFFQARTLFQTITLFSGHTDLYSQKVILMFFLKEQMFYIMFFFSNSCTVFKAAQRQPHSRNYVFIKFDADLFGKRGTSIIIATGLRELFLGSFLECQWFL